MICEYFILIHGVNENLGTIFSGNEVVTSSDVVKYLLGGLRINGTANPLKKISIIKTIT